MENSTERYKMRSQLAMNYNNW